MHVVSLIVRVTIDSNVHSEFKVRCKRVKVPFVPLVFYSTLMAVNLATRKALCSGLLYFAYVLLYFTGLMPDYLLVEEVFVGNRLTTSRIQ